jgi:hypothetical protein
MAALAEMKQEWRLLKHDRPGERFDNHRERMDKGPTWKKVVRAVAGFTLIAVGIVFCILPGPGTVGIVLGLALLAGMSRPIARLMDRIEPKLRHVARRARAFWRRSSTPMRVVLLGSAAIVVGLAAFGAWRFLT